jgi:hypothetical protein
MSAINIDFEITSDLYWLKITDRSSWGLIKDKPAVIEITRPGFASSVAKYFDKGVVSIYNSLLLEGNCVDCNNQDGVPLSDGIYVIKLKGSPSTYSKELKYLKTDDLRMRVDRLYINGIKSDSPFKIDFAEKLLEIETLIKGAEANLRYDKETEAGKLYELASNKTDQLINCKYC